MKVECTLLCFLTLVSAALSNSSATVEAKSAVEVLGITNAPPVNTGFVFIGGRYIPPPYVVSRIGNEIQVNGICVEKFTRWPLQQIHTTISTNLPSIPTNLTKNSDRFNPTFQKYLKDCIDYCMYAGITTNRQEAVARLLERLPCVKRAYPSKKWSVSIVWMVGGLDKVQEHVFPERFRRIQNDDVEATKFSGYLSMLRIIDSLFRGAYYFFPTPSAPHPRQTGRDARPMFAVALPLIDKGASAEEISETVERKTGAPFPVEFCRALLRHRDALMPDFRERIGTRKEK